VNLCTGQGKSRKVSPFFAPESQWLRASNQAAMLTARIALPTIVAIKGNQIQAAVKRV
jgi:hypothetical protein